MFEDYSGAFCALACLRSALTNLKKELSKNNIKACGNYAREVAYFSDEFIKRREKARGARKIIPTGFVCKENKK